MFAATVSAIVRSTLAERKEIRLFLADVPGLGHADSIKLQVWNIFESLSCYSVTQSDVLHYLHVEEAEGGEIHCKDVRFTPAVTLSFSGPVFSHHSPSPS